MRGVRSRSTALTTRCGRTYGKQYDKRGSDNCTREHAPNLTGPWVDVENQVVLRQHTYL